MTWPSVPIRRIFRVVNGGTPTPDPSNWDGSVPWATPVDTGEAPGGILHDTRRTLTSAGAKQGSRVVPAQSILVSTRAPIGYVAVTDQAMAFNQGCRALCPTGELDVRYFAYQLRVMTSELNAAGLGTTFLELSSEALASVRLVAPPVEEQRRIADFLDVQVSRIRRVQTLLQRELSLLEECEKAKLPLTVAGARLGADSVDTGVPWMPKMHPAGSVIPLIRLLQLQRGVDLPESARLPGHVPVVTTAGAVGNHNRSIARGPGVVVGRYGSAGSVHWINCDFWPHNTTMYVRDFRGNDQRYCFHVLRALPYEMEQARSAIPGLNRNDLHKREVVQLSVALQRDVVRQLDRDQEVFAAATDGLVRTFELLEERLASLIAMAVTGTIDVVTTRGVTLP